MAPQLSYAYGANVALGLMLIGLGALAPRLRRPGPARWLLAAYLVVVGVNYFTDGLRFFTSQEQPYRSPLVWVVIVTNILDPALLLLFTVAAAGEQVSARHAALAFLPPVILFAGFLPFPAYRLLAPADLGGGHTLGIGTLYTVAFYLASFAILAVHHARLGKAHERDRFGLVVVAFAVVCLTRAPLLVLDTGWFSGSGRRSPWSLVMEAILAAAFLAYAVASRASAGKGRWPQARRTVVLVAAVLLELEAVWMARFVPVVEVSAFALLYSIRWFLFLAIALAGLRRFELLGIPTATARPLREAYAALLLLAGAVIVTSLLRTVLFDPAAIAGGAITATCGAAVAWVPGAVLPRAELQWRSEAVYLAHAKLGSPPHELERIRRQLGLSKSETEAMDCVARLERRVPRLALPMRVEEGKPLLGRYDIGPRLGAGAFGLVYAATDRVTGDLVVVKELLPEWHHDRDALDAFRKEVETAMQIHHPNLVAFRGLETLANGHVLVLAKVPGETLAERLRCCSLTAKEVRRVGLDVAAGLAALHDRGILHCDVQPANVMLTPKGRAILLDFGSAKTNGGTRPAHRGAPGFASPEQEAGGRLTAASDVYALGATLRHALAGAQLPAALDATWQAVLRACLGEDPMTRPSLEMLSRRLRRRPAGLGKREDGKS